MKQGDVFLAAIKRRDRIAALLKLLTWPEVKPDWLDWLDFIKGNRN